jgi:pimeloyl-ACP methyl ester carboxylesterase
MQGLVECSSWNAGVAILLHSTSGTLETGVQNVLAEACRAQGLTVIRFDARCGLNEDGANFLSFTVSGYRDDVEDVLTWAQAQPWWSGPLTLVGHSAGGLVAGLYAAEHPEDVKELVLLAPTVSGKTYLEAFEHNDPTGLQAWKESRLRTIRHPLSGDPLSLSYAFVEDLLRYDLMPVAAALTMPVTILCGGQDVTSPPAVCAELASAIGPHARLVPIPSMRHAPERRDELRTLSRALYKEMKS